MLVKFVDDELASKISKLDDNLCLHCVGLLII